MRIRGLGFWVESAGFIVLLNKVDLVEYRRQIFDAKPRNSQFRHPDAFLMRIIRWRWMT